MVAARRYYRNLGEKPGQISGNFLGENAQEVGFCFGVWGRWVEAAVEWR
jgi:hypothetical protein